jgi:hypothetical protein
MPQVLRLPALRLSIARVGGALSPNSFEPQHVTLPLEARAQL